MSARSHGTDEPGPGEPEESTAGEQPGADAESASGAPTAPEPSDEAPEDGLDAQWSDLVSRLRGTGDPRSWSPDPAVEEAEDHFEPPEPEPVLGGDPLLTMAWVAVITLPVLVIIAVVAWRDVPTWLLQAAGVTFLIGAGLLVWRMPHEREDDDGPGAIV